MAGVFEVKQNEFERWLEEHGVYPKNTGFAIDLGAGHGIQSISLAKKGFNVRAIDFNPQLIAELKQNCTGYPIEVINDDILSITKYAYPAPELIICWGDTLTHLESKKQIIDFLTDCVNVLADKGTLILSFRDYSKELIGATRFIPVKSDENRILTCFLEYHPNYVTVNDLLYEKGELEWKQTISAYNKVRVKSEEIESYLTNLGMKITFKGQFNRMETIIIKQAIDKKY